MIRKIVVVIGDGACGKTSLSVCFSKNEFPEDHVPTIYDTYTKDVIVDDKLIPLTIRDTAGEEDYDRLRPLNYDKADVFVVCFAIDNPISLENVIEKWAKEARYYRKHAPLILVGNKLDLRHNPETEGAVKYEEGIKAARKIKARDYIECSAKHMMRVQDVFTRAAQLAVEAETDGNESCCSVLCKFCF